MGLEVNGSLFWFEQHPDAPERSLRLSDGVSAGLDASFPPAATSIQTHPTSPVYLNPSVKIVTETRTKGY